MKTKQFIVAMLTCLTIQTNAQTIPNAGFENWTVQSAGWEDPDNWTTNNDGDSLHNSVSVTKTTDSYTGNYALQVINNWHFVEPGPLPGYAIINYADTHLVSKISAYVKCDSISGTGKGMIVVGGYLGGAYNGIASWETTIEIPQYTFIEIPLSPVMSYDSLQIFIYGFASTDGLGVATGHVTLKVDELTEDITADIKESDFNKSLNVSPNPFKEYTELTFENLTGENCNLTIYDSQGKLVRTINNVTTGKIKIERKDLSSGIYTFKIQSDIRIGRGEFIVQ